MTETDETELRRLCALLSKSSQAVADHPDQVEAIEKAGLALSREFLAGHRCAIEQDWSDRDRALGDPEKRHLRALGLAE